MKQLSMERGNAPVNLSILADGYTFRPFQPGDEEGWCRCCIDGELGLNEVSTAEFDRIMGQDPKVKKENIYFLVSNESGIVGTATYQLGAAPGEAVVHMVGIVRTHWGRGLAKPLMLYALDAIIKAGNHRITLTTDDWRVPAIKTYLNVGFAPCIHSGEMDERWKKVMSV
jgi:mycothiol synthase